ncbi:MAG: ABC transporter permease [Rhodospirillales bacterium]|jgi:peptide/nickel transport system permease protein|nr:ABC transporter permease [Rhodospirillales bacterium]
MNPLAIFRSRGWYKFSRNKLSVFGLVLVIGFVSLAILASVITPFPEHAGPFVDFANATKPPSAVYWFGTDVVGRDILTRVVFGYRVSLELAVIVLVIAVPLGVVPGLIAGYFGGWWETVIMRLTDVFLSVPPLVLALAIMGFLKPTLTNAMIAISAMWWPWYTRLLYNLTRQLKNEGYVTAAEVVGAPHWHVLLREILPNCVPSLLTKMTLDMSFVILLAAGLGFLGLGVQPPTPELGSMVAEGANYLPSLWWLPVFSGFAILIAVLGFNLLGDGLRDLLDVDL